VELEGARLTEKSRPFVESQKKERETKEMVEEKKKKGLEKGRPGQGIWYWRAGTDVTEGESQKGVAKRGRSKEQGGGSNKWGKRISFFPKQGGSPSALEKRGESEKRVVRKEEAERKWSAPETLPGKRRPTRRARELRRGKKNLRGPSGPLKV